ncbi:pteridine reductase [Endothiovibrio diazotrophicus]
MNRVVLITGAAHRIGATIARMLHADGCNIALHYRSSAAGAERLAAELNGYRADSISLHQGDLLELARLAPLVEEVVARWGRLDVLVNNASTFYPTAVGTVTETQWEDLMGSNLRAPFFLAQAAAPHLAEHHGCIVNLVDIHAERPMKDHPVYSMAKAGKAMLTKALAKELAPEVRVNGVAPGAILWPENEMSDETRGKILERIALGRKGEPEDIARAVRFFVLDAPYVTGQILAVDGGRSLNL